jgi:hypothetical protein
MIFDTNTLRSVFLQGILCDDLIEEAHKALFPELGLTKDI